MTQKNITIQKESLQQWSLFTLLAALATCNKKKYPQASYQRGYRNCSRHRPHCFAVSDESPPADGHGEKDIHQEAVLQQSAVIAGYAGHRNCITSSIVLRAAVPARGANG